MGRGHYGGGVRTAPGTPYVTVIASTRVDLAWTSGGGTPSNWSVYSFANYGDYMTGRTARYIAALTPVTLTGFANNTTYYIAAYGINVAGISQFWSNMLSITPALVTKGFHFWRERAIY